MLFDVIKNIFNLFLRKENVPKNENLIFIALDSYFLVEIRKASPEVFQNYLRFVEDFYDFCKIHNKCIIFVISNTIAKEFVNPPKNLFDRLKLLGNVCYSLDSMKFESWENALGDYKVNKVFRDFDDNFSLDLIKKCHNIERNNIHKKYEKYRFLLEKIPTETRKNIISVSNKIANFLNKKAPSLELEKILNLENYKESKKKNTIRDLKHINECRIRKVHLIMVDKRMLNKNEEEDLFTLNMEKFSFEEIEKKLELIKLI